MTKRPLEAMSRKGLYPKFDFDTLIYKNFVNWTKQWGNCERYKNSQKRPEKQSDLHEFLIVNYTP